MYSFKLNNNLSLQSIRHIIVFASPIYTKNSRSELEQFYLYMILHE